MSNTNILRGFATLTFYAADHEAAKKWYTELTGIPPYFEKPGYAEFRLGDYQNELGIIDSKYAPKSAGNGPGGAVIYWHVDDIQAGLEKLLQLGATTFEPVTERGHGFVTASVVDPFGNILGIMYNPHYVEVLKANEK
ncbi:hypothetical protein SAMN05660461_2770 [Chitinophaga ginsengisegetis]|uniref:VOC domain-containing protein n=1 Tax=Chitinophaga ginsengisegetis TaxID=393003 RepID=A0A1T5NUI8_9BACT|nr:VOC family protein [Chitinophaga ginsengisegetis]SKD04160.1 hypothetical protein SAMN05660461_2770 [Chitinophaga ginsengisegetis]